MFRGKRVESFGLRFIPVPRGRRVRIRYRNGVNASGTHFRSRVGSGL